MTTTCEAARYISDNAEKGRMSELICKNVLKRAFSLAQHLKDAATFQTGGALLYDEYIHGEEDLPDYTRWAVEWLFGQKFFPEELPRSWEGNPIIDRTLFLPDTMRGLKKAADKFIAAHCNCEEAES